MALLAALVWAAVALAVIQCIWTLRNWRLLTLCNQIPGPGFIPLIGNFFSILANDFDFIKMVYIYRERYGHIYRIWFGHLVYVGLSQAKDVESIMSSQKFIHKSRDYSNLHPWLGTGLLTSTGPKWQHRRKIITPTFHFRILDRFMDSFNRNSRILVEKMSAEHGRPAFDVHHYISLCTLDIICECAMGTRVNAQHMSTESSYVKAVNSMCWLLYYRGIRPWLRIPFIFNRTANGKLFNNNLQALHAMSKEVIRKRKEEFLEELRQARDRKGSANGAVNETDNGAANETANGAANKAANGAANKAANGAANKTVDGAVNKTADDADHKTANGAANKTVDGAVNKTVDGADHKTANGAANKTANGAVDGPTGVDSPANDTFTRTPSEQLSDRVNADSGVSDQDDAYGSKKRSAFLDHLLELAESENLSDDDIREEVDTIMFEGHDTTGAALSFALYSLATNQHVQDKLYEELHGIFGDSERDATFQDLANMKYLEMVIKETLRLYPSVPLFWRDIREEVTLGSGYKLPAGATVALNMFMLGRNPDAFEDPEHFDPDRFLPGNWHGKHPFDYTPFSAGPRNCVGQKFAMLEMKVCLAHVVRSFRLLPPPQSFSLDLAVEIVLKSRSGVLVRVERRVDPRVERRVEPSPEPSLLARASV